MKRASRDLQRRMGRRIGDCDCDRGEPEAVSVNQKTAVAR